MKLFAQHGAQAGKKINEGIERELLDGVVFSPKNISKTNLDKVLDELSSEHPEIERLFDPQLYACFHAANGDSRLGFLEEDYPYFTALTRRQLEQEMPVIKCLRQTFRFQTQLEVSGIIAPNILIPRSLNSIEAVISKNFIRNAGRIYAKLKDDRPLYVTLAISREALIDKRERDEFLKEITMLNAPPHGFYLLVGSGSPEARLETSNADTLSAWMLLNHALKINGFEVINGYSDILSPFLGAVGGDVGCTGWFSNLRTFSLSRFGPSTGGRLPTPRYLSKKLINRISFFELDQLRTRHPGVLNGLDSDGIYDEEEGSAPQRNQEVLQSWEALRSLNTDLVGSTIRGSLRACLGAIDDAEELYAAIGRGSITLGTKSNSDHLEPLEEAIRLFASAAEIKLPA